MIKNISLKNLIKTGKNSLIKVCLVLTFFVTGGTLVSEQVSVAGPPPTSVNRLSQLAVPILGVTLNKDYRPVGIVTHVVINFQERKDHDGLKVNFRAFPGRFSPLAQEAVQRAITRASDAAHLRPDSWTVFLTFPYKGLTMYGDSLSAMIGLSVVALAKGDPIIYGRSITGTITEDGHIGVVGGVPQKIRAAHHEHMDRVLIPEELDAGDGDWQNPFLMHISPVGTVDKAYLGLTGHALISSASPDQQHGH